MRTYRNVALFGAVAVLLWRAAELLFMQSADGYYYESTAALRLVLPAVGIVVVLLAGRAKMSPRSHSGSLCTLTGAIAAASVVTLSVVTAVSSVRAADGIPLFSAALGSIQRIYRLKLWLTLIFCVMGAFMAVWLVLTAVGRKPRGYTAITVAAMVWFWLRILCGFISEPVNPYNSAAYISMLQQLAAGLAYSKLAAFEADASSAESVRGFCAACFAVNVGCGAADLAASVFGAGAADPVNTICSFMLGAYALLLAEKCLKGNEKEISV